MTTNEETPAKENALDQPSASDTKALEKSGLVAAVIDWVNIERKWKADEACENLTFKANFLRVFEAMKTAGIDFATVRYNGGHDEGCIGSPDFYRNLRDDESIATVGVVQISDGVELDILAAPLGEVAGKVSWQNFKVDEKGYAAVPADAVEVEIKAAVKELSGCAAMKFVGAYWWDGDYMTDGALFFDVENKEITNNATRTTSELVEGKLGIEDLEDES